MENEWLKKVGSLELDEKRALVDREITELSQRELCALLGIHRFGLCYEPRQPRLEDLDLMRAIDEVLSTYTT